ncbi:MAG: ATP-binding cassette domain-containing protein [Proteobacteria bacterium]|nr:ATP-binding cassette domain-containing protein [Pseudomonadota bacterium]
MLQLTSVSYQYRPKQPWAINDISLALPRGSFHLLSGPSGAGKTTLFKLLTLSLLPTKGNLTFAGKNVSTASRTELAALRRKMGVVFQDFRLLPHLTVQENVELPLTLHGALTPHNKEAVKEMLEWVGLTKLARKPAAELSGGEQQRTAIARAVVHQPELLVADEPTGNVDAAMARKILHLFTELHKHGTTIVLATHDTGLLKSQHFPVIHLENGAITNPGESA